MVNLTFFCSPIGLGHATRDIAIAEYFHNISTTFVTGNGAAKLFANYGFNVKDKYNPPSFEYKNGILKNSLRWLWSYYKYYKECKNLSSSIFSDERPDLVISDEDFASLSVAQEKKIPNILITDILETKFTTGFGSIIEKKMNKSMKEIIKKCDAVIIPEEGNDEDNIRRVGPIVRKTKFSRDELRQKFSFNKKTIVLCVGGTDAGKFLIQKTLEIIPDLAEDIQVVLVSGPSLEKDFTRHVENLGFVNNLHEIIFAADLVISLAGKSTIDESKVYGTPGIFIPLKDHFEQEDNAKEEGFSYDDVFRLKSLIQEKLEQNRHPVNFQGAEKAYDIIKKFLK